MELGWLNITFMYQNSKIIGFVEKLFFLPPSLKMISYEGVEVSIIFTINLFLSDHTETLPIFSEKMVFTFAMDTALSHDYR